MAKVTIPAATLPKRPERLPAWAQTMAQAIRAVKEGKPLPAEFAELEAILKPRKKGA